MDQCVNYRRESSYRPVCELLERVEYGPVCELPERVELQTSV